MDLALQVWICEVSSQQFILFDFFIIILGMLLYKFYQEMKCVFVFYFIYLFW